MAAQAGKNPRLTRNNCHQKGVTYKKVWAMMKETGRQMKETDRQIKETDRQMKETDRMMKENAERQKETDRQIKETDRQIKETDRHMKETDRQMKETDRMMKENAEQQKENAERQKETDRQMKETDRHMKETDQKIGKLYNRFGELAEHLVAPNIEEKFNKLGFNFTKTSPNVRIKELDNPDIRAEIDLFLENGDVAIAVEVKAKPNQEHVDDHVVKMEKLRIYADKRNDTRRYQGAIAGAILSDSIRTYIIKKGFYLIEQTGDTVKISIPDGFKARNW